MSVAYLDLYPRQNSPLNSLLLHMRQAGGHGQSKLGKIWGNFKSIYINLQLLQKDKYKIQQPLPPPDKNLKKSFWMRNRPKGLVFYKKIGLFTSLYVYLDSYPSRKSCVTLRVPFVKDTHLQGTQLVGRYTYAAR